MVLFSSFLGSGCSESTSTTVDKNLVSEIENLWDNGNPKTVRFYREESGKKVLVMEKQYYPGGELSMEGSFSNDLREGEWKSWYEDGTLWSTGSFKAGKRDGKGIIYHPNGNKSIEGSYKEGIRTGLWMAWDEAGNIISEQQFD